MSWILGIAFVLCLLVAVLSVVSRHQPISGLVGGHLRPCSNASNCVSSEDQERSSFIEPIVFEGRAEVAWERLKAVIQQAGGKVERESDGYLWATFTTKVFRFVDDVELRMDGNNKTIHLRSASRVGYSDMGVNRRRIENVRAIFDRQHNRKGG